MEVQKPQQLSAVNVLGLNKLQLPGCFSLNETCSEFLRLSCTSPYFLLQYAYLIHIILFDK